IRVVWWSVFIFTVCTGIIALTSQYWHIGVFRFVSGFGLAGVYSIGTLLAAEYVPTPIRTTVLGTLQAGWSVGYVVAALLSAYILPRFGWRPLFMCAVLPGIVAMALLWRIADPPSFALARQEAAAHGTSRRNGWLELWATPAMRRTFLLWSFAAIALRFGYYGANTWLPSYLVKDLGVNLQ